jgi:hypothetical protein
MLVAPPPKSAALLDGTPSDDGTPTALAAKKRYDQFDIRAIGGSDNDHLRDTHLPPLPICPGTSSDTFLPRPSPERSGKTFARGRTQLVKTKNQNNENK